MIRISVLGATGRVGTVLCAAIAEAPDLTLAEAISATGSGDSTPLDHAQLGGADVLVDFSTPGAVMAMLDRLADSPLPLVIGTTGFTPDQAARLRDEAARRPILIGANFTQRFEAFAAAGDILARALPGAAITVGEVYNARKKPVASGTTQRLCRDLGGGTRPVETDIARIGDTPGINTITLAYGVATITLGLTVHDRAAYAAGALDAARWLIGRPHGAYAPKDMLSQP